MASYGRKFFLIDVFTLTPLSMLSLSVKKDFSGGEKERLLSGGRKVGLLSKGTKQTDCFLMGREETYSSGGRESSTSCQEGQREILLFRGT